MGNIQIILIKFKYAFIPLGFSNTRPIIQDKIFHKEKSNEKHADLDGDSFKPKCASFVLIVSLPKEKHAEEKLESLNRQKKGRTDIFQKLYKAITQVTNMNIN